MSKNPEKGSLRKIQKPIVKKTDVISQFIPRLPPDLVRMVAEFLRGDDLMNFSKVNDEFRDAALHVLKYRYHIRVLDIPNNAYGDAYIAYASTDEDPVQYKTWRHNLTLEAKSAGVYS
jgi:hypothetical protein